MSDDLISRQKAIEVVAKYFDFIQLNETGWYTQDDDIADDPVAWMPLPDPHAVAKGDEK